MLVLTEEFIQKSIQDYQNLQESRSAEVSAFFKDIKLRQAAVMIPLLQDKREWHVLLTHRSQNLVEHRGQVAFPGGAKDRDDQDLQATALREMHEEVGILPDDVHVFGHLGELRVITGYTVRLYVGKIPWPYDLKINEREVDSVFNVPLEWLADPNHRSVEFRNHAGYEFPVIFFDDFDGHQLWGASADMTMTLLDALNFSNELM